MAIEIFSSEKYRSDGYSCQKIFEHLPDKFWGVYISYGLTNSFAKPCIHLYRATVYYSKAELMSLTIFEDDAFFSHLKEIKKTHNIEPTQETIKIAEELMKYGLTKMLEQPNFGSKIGFLCDKLYRSGMDDGRESIQTEIKKILDL